MTGILVRNLAQIAAAEPDRLAVIDHGEAATYGTLFTRARRTASWLREQGVAPGDAVGLTVRDTIDNLASTYALMMLGCTQVPLASFDPVPLRESLAARCGASLVLVDDSGVGLPGLAALPLDLPRIGDDPALDRPAPPGHGTAEGTLILSTSGTTGKPKLIPVTEEQLHGYGQVDIPDADRFPIFQSYSIEMNAGKWLRLARLVRGKTLLVADLNRVSLAELCARYGARHLALPLDKLQGLIHAADTEPNARLFRGICFSVGGALVDTRFRSAFREAVSEHLYVTYGASECGIVSAAGPDEQTIAPASVGRVRPGMQVRIVDEQGRPVPDGSTGFVRIRSAWSATRYLDDPEASERMFPDGWFQPGDVGSLSPEGLLTIIGRGDDMMLLNAINIFPAEIESAAAAFPGVRECAAFPMRGTAHGDIPLLAVVADAGLEAEQLLAWCRSRLGVRAPRKVFVLGELPRNAMGKVLRRELERVLGRRD